MQLAILVQNVHKRFYVDEIREGPGDEVLLLPVVSRTLACFTIPTEIIQWQPETPMLAGSIVLNYN